MQYIFCRACGRERWVFVIFMNYGLGINMKTSDFTVAGFLSAYNLRKVRVLRSCQLLV